MRTLYRFKYEERAGELHGLFVRDSYYVSKCLDRREDERTARFGEVLGKHSEVGVALDSSNVTRISSDPADVEWFQRLFGAGVGYDPFNYLEENLD